MGAWGEGRGGRAEVILTEGSEHADSSSSAGGPRFVLIAARSFEFSIWSAFTDCWSDSRRNFFRTRDRFACSRFRSLFVCEHEHRASESDQRANRETVEVRA